MRCIDCPRVVREMGGWDKKFSGSVLEEEVRICDSYLPRRLTGLCLRVLAMISGHSDDHIPHTSAGTGKAHEVITEIRSISRIDSPSPNRARKPPRMIAPFIPAHDIPRGAIHALQALLGYTLMLAVMYVLLMRLFVLGR